MAYHSLCGVYIPTAFSPNNDGINDSFYVMGGNDKIVIESMQIFDRWGDLVFNNEDGCSTIGDIACGWSGLINQQEAAVGVYVYSIVLRLEGGNETFLFKGEVAIVK